MKTFQTSDKPLNSKKIYNVQLTAAKLRQGFTSDNSEMFYTVDEFDRTIVLEFRDDFSIGSEILKWNQYADHKGGSFTVSDEQQRRFNNMLKSVKRRAIK